MLYYSSYGALLNMHAKIVNNKHQKLCLNAHIY